MSNQKLSHHCKLNLIMSPHRVRCHDHTGRQRESVAMYPVPVNLYPKCFLNGTGQNL